MVTLWTFSCMFMDRFFWTGWVHRHGAMKMLSCYESHLKWRAFNFIYYKIMMCICVCLCVDMCGWVQVPSEAKRGLWMPSELDVQMVWSLLVWMLGTKPGSSRRAAGAYSHWAISPALLYENLTGTQRDNKEPAEFKTIVEQLSFSVVFLHIWPKITQH